MANFKTIRDSALRWAVFGSFAALFMGTIAYALTYNWSDPGALRGKIAGNQLQSSQWNLLVGNVDNLNERLSNAENQGWIVPIGTVIAYNGTSCPTGWTEADGSAVPTGIGGSSTLDLRGEFIRGLDGGRNVDAWRWVGTFQSDLIKAHNHWIALDWNAGSAFLRFGNPNSTWWVSDMWNTNHFTTTSGGMNLDAANAETRPRNVALLYCVKN